MENNPTTVAPPLPSPGRAPRRLDAGEGASFWSEAWRIFSAAPLVWMAIAVAYFVISIVLYLIPVVGSIAQSVLTPVFLGGVMVGCDALARGEPLRFEHLFAGFDKGRLGPLAIVGLVLLAIFIVFGIVMAAGVFATIGMSGLGALMDYGNPAAIAGAAGVGVFVLVALGLIGAVLIFMAFWFAPALVVLDGMEPIAAIKRSFEGSLVNVLPFLVYDLIYIGLAIVASIPFGLGWLVLGPMVAGSFYSSWRRVFRA